jgi:hypothetical protein
MIAQPSTPVDGPAAAAQRSSVQPLGVQWTALHDAAAAVAALAGLEAERPPPRVRNFPALIKDVGGWRFDLAAELIGDLTAMMRPGLTALLAVNARGQDAAAAAVTLWREFHHARNAVLALAPDDGELGPRRST